jgi:hypothetical protein
LAEWRRYWPDGCGAHDFLDHSFDASHVAPVAGVALQPATVINRGRTPQICLILGQNRLLSSCNPCCTCRACHATRHTALRGDLLQPTTNLSGTAPRCKEGIDARRLKHFNGQQRNPRWISEARGRAHRTILIVAESGDRGAYEYRRRHLPRNLSRMRDVTERIRVEVCWRFRLSVPIRAQSLATVWQANISDPAERSGRKMEHPERNDAADHPPRHLVPFGALGGAIGGRSAARSRRDVLCRRLG